MSPDVPHVLIVGAGFAGFHCARELERLLRPGEARVTLASPNDYMLYSPLLPPGAETAATVQTFTQHADMTSEGRPFGEVVARHRPHGSSPILERLTQVGPAANLGSSRRRRPDRMREGTRA